MRKACQDAMLVLLKSEEPALMELQQRLVRGLTALKADRAAEEAIRRRDTYESHVAERAPLRDVNW